jgi:hypothetical protein
MRIDRSLLDGLIQANRWDHARSAALSSLECFPAILRHGAEPSVRWHKNHCLRVLATVSDAEGKVAESVAHLQSAIRLSDEMVERDHTHGWIATSVGNRRALTWLLATHGHPDQARSVIAVSRRMLDAIPIQGDSPGLAVERILADTDHELLGDGPPLPSASGSLRAASAGTGPSSKRASAGADVLAPNRWAELVEEALCCGNPDPGSAAREVCGPRYYLLVQLHDVAAALRRLEQLPDARRIAERMRALGSRMVARHPDQPAAYLALSTAYANLYKNAWRTKDRSAVETNMRLALEAARKARFLDPNNEAALQQVDTLQRKLEDLLAPR